MKLQSSFFSIGRRNTKLTSQWWSWSAPDFEEIPRILHYDSKDFLSLINNKYYKWFLSKPISMIIYFLFITIHDIPFSLISKSVSPQTDSTGLSCCIPWGHPHIIASFVAVYDSLHFIKSILSVPVGATQHITWPVPTRFPSTLKSNH